MKQFCPQNHDTFTVGRTKFGACRECSRLRTKDWQKKHRTSANAANKRWRKLHWQDYRLKYANRIQESARKQEWKGVLNGQGVQFTSYDWRVAYALQEGRCANALCRRQSKLHMDHDHKTMVFRGLLCQGCNRALGMCQDSSEKLKGLIIYLEGAHEETNVSEATGC